MAQYPQPIGGGGPSGRPYFSEGSAAAPRAVVTFFNAVYAWMAAGLALTAVIGWYVSTRPDVMQMVFRPIVLIPLIIIQFVLVGTVAAAVRRIPTSAATVLFLLYAALNGLTLSGIFLVYAHAVIFTAFIVSAGMFAAMTVFGLVTQRDLSGMGSFLFMALIGLVIASVVNVFWYSNVLSAIINYVGVLIFVGLTAYDTQKLKAWAYETASDTALAARLSISGALTLYLDFLNLFLFLVQILGSGDRRR